MIVGLDHAGICVRDLQRSLRFYRDLLGLDLVYEGSWKGDGRMDAVVGLEGSAGYLGGARRG
jgi:catechol 2,3-dioxygenase-like lactoylglutathione lyase family enzyme